MPQCFITTRCNRCATPYSIPSSWENRTAMVKRIEIYGYTCPVCLKKKDYGVPLEVQAMKENNDILKAITDKLKVTLGLVKAEVKEEKK